MWSHAFVRRICGRLAGLKKFKVGYFFFLLFFLFVLKNSQHCWERTQQGYHSAKTNNAEILFTLAHTNNDQTKTNNLLGWVKQSPCSKFAFPPRPAKKKNKPVMSCPFVSGLYHLIWQLLQPRFSTNGALGFDGRLLAVRIRSAPLQR